VTWDEEEYGRRLKIGGGKERIASLFPDADAERGRIAALHKRKTAIYKEIVRSGRLPGRPGIARVVAEALAAGWTLAVASTSAEESVRAVLEHVVGAETAARFAVFAGDVVPAKKPDPGIYLLALGELGVDPAEALVVEDSRNGLLAAHRAGLRCLVTLSSYTHDEDMSEAVLVVTSLGDPGTPARVVANRGAAHPGDVVTLADLEACLTGPRPEKEAA
jgi:HAD superfamily hydrolase (TIGR01509 family)